jgi:hypothetical protein
MLLGAAGIPLSLIWDYSWECTIGVDLFWGPPHTATYFSVVLAGLGAVGMVSRNGDRVRLGFLSAPAGAWIGIWGALAFVAAVLFDRWWQGAYGLGAGIWHPPQICKAVAFFAILCGTLVCCASAQSRDEEDVSFLCEYGVSVAGGLILMLVWVVTLKGSMANWQHGGSFYEVACGVYALPLAAIAIAGKGRWPATGAALVYMGLSCATIWLLPLFSAKPLIAPVYNFLDHMMPPPFPLLLVLPALVLDLILKRRLKEASLLTPAATKGTFRLPGWMYSSLLVGMVAVGFAGVLVAVQWFFSEFLLSKVADNWFFAGGGQHWPFFLRISEQARRVFWSGAGDDVNESNLLVIVVLAMVSTRVGLWVGEWLKGVRR